MTQTPPRPYCIACIEPLASTTVELRREAAARAGFNVSLLDLAVVDIDLRTDSAASCRLIGQLAASHTSQHAPDDPASHEALAEEIRSLTGLRHVSMFAQGRAAEAALADVLPLQGARCAANTLFRIWTELSAARANLLSRTTLESTIHASPVVALRAVLLHPEVEREDLDALVGAVRAAGRKVAARFGDGESL